MKLATALATALVFSAGASQAMTVLTFDGNVCSAFIDGSGALTSCIAGSRINQSYGDGSGVDVSWRESPGSNNSAAFWPDSYSGMDRVAYGSTPLITLAGAVTLQSFDIGSWPNVNRTTQVTVVDLATSTTVLSTGTITILGSAPTNFALNLYSPVGFTINFGPDGFNVGIDNIAFTAGVVPEPGTLALLAAGLGVVGGAARRRHKA